MPRIAMPRNSGKNGEFHGGNYLPYIAGWIPVSNRQLEVAESFGFKGDFRQWQELLRIGD